MAFESPEVGGAADLAEVHAREADRLLAYLCSADRALGPVRAEAVCQQAFLEVRASWPRYAPYSRPEVYVFAAAQRIATGRGRIPGPGGADALTESAPDYWDPSDVARLTVLQNCLDRLSAVPRQSVILREMCGFSPSEVAEIIGLPEPAVESARGDALRTLVPMVEAGTSHGNARQGPLSPEDFAALGRVLQHTDPRHVEDRRRFALSLAPAASAPTAPAVPSAPPVAASAPQSDGSFSGASFPAGSFPGGSFSGGSANNGASFPGGAPNGAFSHGVPPNGAPHATGAGGPAEPALFASAGAPAERADSGEPAGWMGGFGARRAPGAPGAAAPPTVSAAPLGDGGVPRTVGGALGVPEPTPRAAPAPRASADVSIPDYPTPPSLAAPARTSFAAPPQASFAAPAQASFAAPATAVSAVPQAAAGGLRSGTTALDSPLFALAAADIDTPIFDSVSAWFSRPAEPGPRDGGTNGHAHPDPDHWESLHDSGWQEANARASAGPRVAGSTGAGLPVRSPGANMVPSATDAALGMTHLFGHEAPRPDAGRVRSRLDSFQHGLQSARQVRDQGPDDPPVDRSAVCPSVDRASTLRAPLDRAPLDRAPLDRAPVDDLPAEDLSVEEVPAKEVPAKDVPADRPPQQAPPAARAPQTPPADRAEPAPPAPTESVPAETEVSPRRGREGGFGTFYREYLPHLLALLMVEGARPAVAAQLAQDAMSEAYREWAQLENPRDWTRQVALSSWAVRRRSPDAGAVPPG